LDQENVRHVFGKPAHIGQAKPLFPLLLSGSELWGSRAQELLQRSDLVVQLAKLFGLPWHGHPSLVLSANRLFLDVAEKGVDPVKFLGLKWIELVVVTFGAAHGDA